MKNIWEKAPPLKNTDSGKNDRGICGGTDGMTDKADSDNGEDMGTLGAKQDMFAEYKRKYPRHSSFQAEMRKYFGKI